MRTYERIHPWISFRLDLSRSGPRLWMDLGEAASKCEHIANVPLRPATAVELHRLFLAKGALGTTAIEGNTLTESEVLEHLGGRLELPRSKEYLAQEIDNIVSACEAIGGRCKNGEDELTVASIRDFNARVLEKLPHAENVVPGRIREDSVVVGNIYRGAPAQDCEYLVERLCAWLNGPDFRALEGMEFAYAILEAVVAHLYIAWIHPFDDGNGRTARLIEFEILLAAGVPTPAAHLLSNHYNQTRAEYYRQLDLASKSGGDVLPFIEYAVRGFVDGLREQLQLIRAQEFDVVWRNYVHERFHEKNSPHEVRQRHLVLDLSLHRKAIAIAQLTEISPRIARAYAGKSAKTLQRDLVALAELDLIERTANDVRAKREHVQGFLPWSKRGERV